MADTIRERNEQGIVTFFSTLKSVYGEINSFREDISNLDVDEVVGRLEDASSTVQLMLYDIENRPDMYDLQGLLGTILACNDEIRSCLQEEHCENLADIPIGDESCSYACPTVATKRSRMGRPAIFVDEEQIKFLHGLHFTWKKMAKLLNISESTLQRRRGSLEMEQYTCISDEQLKEKIKLIQELTPNIGQKRLLGALRARGIVVQRERVRYCLRELDPLGTALRWRLPIYRRKYSVPCPNALWHLDGNHKLAHYKMVVHCCVDGYSRVIVYVHCTNNNRARTVLELFKEGVTKYGLPSRVRTDRGLENIDVARFMFENRGLNRGTVITGSSVHNTRVECMHRDVYAGVLCFFVRIFDYLEASALFDSLNDVHMYALHFIYIPRINRSLQEFIQQWNSHPLSTEGNMSPLQLYTAGILNNMNSGYTALDNFATSPEVDAYGFDPNPIFPALDQSYQVTVPDVHVQLTESQMQSLVEQCNPLTDDHNNGMQQYCNCLQLLSRMLGTN